MVLTAVLTTAASVGATYWVIAFAGLVVALGWGRGLYASHLDPRLLDTMRSLVTATVLATTVTISVRVFAGDLADIAVESATLWALATSFLVTGRIALTSAERRARISGVAGQPTLIVGAGTIGQLVAARLRAHPEIGLRPVGFLDKEPRNDGGALALPVLGASWHLDRVVADHGIRHVIVAFSTAPAEVLVSILNRCEQLGVKTSFVPRLFEKTTQRFTVDRLGALPLISTQTANPRGWQFALKYAGDRIAAAFAIVLLAPVLVAAALAVYVSLGRPVLYRQERVGRDGRRFEMLKFRSMRPAPPDELTTIELPPDTAPGGVEGADRRTRVGTVLRRTSLDELPQLFNVLKGDMSFIGPRPERPEFVEVFERTIPRYGERHRVKSGITGWAQVNGLRGNTSLADRAEWDNYYIENWSLWFDLKILLATVVAVVRPGAVE